MSWFYLIMAIACEVSGTTMMKLSNGFSNLAYSIGMFISYAVSFTFLTFALKYLDMSIAYAIWCAVGIILISLIGIYYFNEPVNLVKIVSTLLIIVGVVGLKLSSSY